MGSQSVRAGSKTNWRAAASGGFIEGLSGRKRHVHLGDPPVLADDDVELDHGLLELFAFDFGVVGLDEANELRRRDQRLLLFLRRDFGAVLRMQPHSRRGS